MPGSRGSGVKWFVRYQYWLILGGGLTVALLLMILVPSFAWANPTLGLSAQTVPPTQPPTVPPTQPPPTAPPTQAPYPEPSPQPSPEPTKKRPDEPCSRGEISGVVTDDCYGQPATGVQVKIDGAVVTTDSQGHFSLSGLSDGRYTVELLVPNAPPPVTVDLLCDQVVILNLTYNSCSSEATPAAPEFLPVTGAEPQPPMNTWVVWFVTGIVGLGLILPALVLIWRKTRS